MSFQAEHRLVRLRPRAGRLVLPTLVLGLVCGGLAFVENRSLEAWQQLTLNIIGAAVVLFFWSVPLTRHLMKRLEITTSRLIWRDVVFSGKSRDVSWHEVAAVEYSRGRITVFIHSQEPLVLANLPKAKALTREMQNLVRG